MIEKWLEPIVEDWRDTWWHRIEEKGETPEVFLAGIETGILGRALPEAMHGFGAVSSPTEDEVARVALSALFGAYMVGLNRHHEGRYSHATFEVIGEVLGIAAVPWMHVLGMTPACAAATAAAEAPAAVRCITCGVQIYGEVADRGACYSCFPKVPDDEADELGS